jgi:hypothetical protein
MMFNSEEEELRFLRWVDMISDWDPYRKSRPGIAEPTEEEMDRVLTAPCKYQQAASDAPT